MTAILHRITPDDDAPVYSVEWEGFSIGTIRQRYGVWMLLRPGCEILAAATDLDRLATKAAQVFQIEVTPPCPSSSSTNTPSAPVSQPEDSSSTLTASRMSQP